MIHGTSMMVGMGWIGLLLMLVLWGGSIALILWGMSSLFPAGPLHSERDALAILRRRYAQGELSHAEFLHACAALDHDLVEQLQQRRGHPSAPEQEA